MTHVGARAIYHLGREVAKAREMGSYHLVERLGVGGMGEVWRAEHRMLARPAAIKLVRPDVLGRGGEGEAVTLKRFKQEAQATALLRSPHTIGLFDFGVSGDGAFYYVMELLDGFDLEKMVKEFGPIPAERAIPLLQQACDSLAEAHEGGLIHRDVKPANVFVCRYGRHVDFVKVLDFGLVKHQADMKITADNVIRGTPAYMSPEQAIGDQDIDGRADIYALGCVAYWMITGQTVFEGSVVRTMRAHVKETPVPPSGRTELDVPPALDALILRCLAKNPDKRPQTADELASLLGECETAGAWTTEKAKAWWERARPTSTAMEDHRLQI
jgi:serine/threonine-protein kinase